MAAAQTDMFKKTGAGTVTTLAAPGKALSATSITVGATTNHPTDTGIVIAIRQVDSAGELVAGTYTEWNAIVASGTSFTIEAAPVYGSDQVYPAGSTTQVFIPLSSSAHNDLIDGILTHADQDGTLKAGAVDVAAVLATDVVETAKIKDLNVTTAKIAADAVTATKIDWASTGADGGIWWEELGRTTLGSAGDTITVSSIPVRKYLKILVSTVDSGGTTNQPLQFNNDSGANYSTRYSVNNAADTTGTSTTAVIIYPSTNAADKYSVVYVNNIATTEKLVVGHGIGASSVGATSPPDRIDFTGKWVNTTDSITRVDVTNAGTGSFATGSEVVVLGHN